MTDTAIATDPVASVAVAGSLQTVGSAAVAGSIATAGSAAVAGSIATAGSVAVAGSIATAGSAGIAGSVASILGIQLFTCVATLACIRCTRCIACVGCIGNGFEREYGLSRRLGQQACFALVEGFTNLTHDCRYRGKRFDTTSFSTMANRPIMLESL